MNTSNVRALSGRDQLRLRIKRTSAIGAFAIASMAFASTAQAQDECGAATGSTVTCAPSGNPYPNGVTYIAPADDLTIVLQDGVRIDTTDSLNIGLLAVGDNAFTVNGGTNTIITTDAPGGFGALVSNNDDALSVTLDRIVTSGPNAIGVVASSSTGAITVKTNNIATTGIGADAINASTNTSAITINSGTISTTGVGAVGIDARSDAGNIGVTSGSINSGGAGILAQTGGTGTITVNSGPVTTTGALSTGISAINNTGALSVTSGAVTTSGLEADGINVASAGTATVNSGAISTSGVNADGIVATGGTGANVTFTNITTTGANANGVVVPAGVLFFGPRASATASVNGGNVSTTGATSDGVRAVAGTGAANVNVTGNISTQGITSRGIFATGPTGVSVTNGGTISTTGATSNGVDASSTTGPVVVTVRNVTTTGAGSNGVLVNAVTGNATATVNGAVNTSGTGASALTVTSGNNAVVNVATGGSVLATQGNSINLTSVGTSTLNNAGTIANNTSGFAVVAAGGPITINNTGSLSSDVVLTAGADRINNSGTFVVGPNPDFGAGADVFANTGTVLIGSGAAAPVAVVFTGLETATNSGTIDMRNGRTGDTLTLPGTYAGTNGTLGLDINFNGTTNPSDQLIIGGVASGTTNVALNQVAGSQPVFNPGTVVVNAATGSSAGAFEFAGGSLDQGFVRYEIQYDATTGDYSLTGAPSDSAYRTLNFVEGIRSLWMKSADTVSGQLRAQRDALWTYGGTEPSGRLWIQMHGSKERREGQRDFNTFGQSRLTNTGYEQNYFGGQIGLDVAGGISERGGFALGVTGGYINSSQDFAGSQDSVRYNVANAGVYGSFTSGNFFINALGKYDYYWANARSISAGYTQKFKGGVYGARGEAGIRLGSDSFFIEPAASISWVKNDFDDLTPLGTTVRFNDDDGLRGRAGGRIGSLFDMGGSKMALYAGANYVHEFKAKDSVTFTGGGQTLTYTNDRLNDYGEATLGLTIAQGAAISGFFEGNYIRSFKKDGSDLGIEGFGGRAGIRAKF